MADTNNKDNDAEDDVKGSEREVRHGRCDCGCWCCGGDGSVNAPYPPYPSSPPYPPNPAYPANPAQPPNPPYPPYPPYPPVFVVMPGAATMPPSVVAPTQPATTQPTTTQPTGGTDILSEILKGLGGILGL